MSPPDVKVRFVDCQVDRCEMKEYIMSRNGIVLASILMVNLLLIGCSGESENSISSNELNDATDLKPKVIPTDPIDAGIVEPEYRDAGWYARTAVSATALEGKVYTHKSAGVFGELLQSSDAKDSHDIPGYGPSLFQVILIPEFSDDTAVGYYSEYKAYDENRSKKVWTFQLKNQNTVDLSNASITIALEGVFDVEYKEENGHVLYKESTSVNEALKSRLTLIDIDHQVSYTLSELETVDLGMDGKHTRTFRWVFGTVETADFEPLNAPQRAAGRNSALEFEIVPKETGGGKFGFPPL